MKNVYIYSRRLKWILVSLWMKYEYLMKKEEVQQHEKTELKKVSLVLFEGSVKNKNKVECWVIK